MAFKRRTHVECLSELEAWVKAGEPFCSLRLTDGELWSMFRYRPETDVTADGNTMNYELGDAIRQTIREFAEAVLKNPDAHIQFGTTAYQYPDETTKWLMGYVNSLGAADKMRWINGHDMLDGVVDGRTKRLMESIRDCGKHVILMGDKAIGGAARCLGATFIAVPKPNSWYHRKEVVAQLVPYLEDDPQTERQCPLIVWCCGMGMKPVTWQLWKTYPCSSHMDAGHIFDGAFGIMSREWLRNKEEPWYTPYFRDFAPWVLSSISK